MEPSRGSAETSLLSYGNEIAEMSQLHIYSLSVFPMKAHGKNSATLECKRNPNRCWKILRLFAGNEAPKPNVDR